MIFDVAILGAVEVVRRGGEVHGRKILEMADFAYRDP